MTLTAYDAQMKKRILLGYEIDNSCLKTNDVLDIIPIIDKIKVIEVRFYLNNHIKWFYNYAFLHRHTMTEDIDRYINNLNDSYIIALARNIINYKPLKEIRVINTLQRHTKLLQTNFSEIKTDNTIR